MGCQPLQRCRRCMRHMLVATWYLAHASPYLDEMPHPMSFCIDGGCEYLGGEVQE
jgi:hypothetical protein